MLQPYPSYLISNHPLLVAKLFYASHHALSSLFPATGGPPPAPAGTGNWLSDLISSPITIGAIITTAGAIAVAIWTALYNSRKNERFQRELSRQSIQAQQNLARQNEQLQRDLIRTRKALEQEYILQAQQDQRTREIETAEIKRQRMLRAPNNEKRADLYRDALLNDPRLSTIKILDMPRPLETLNVYVRVRLSKDTQLPYQKAWTQEREKPLRDPNAVFQEEWKRRRQRFPMALDPEAAIQSYPRCVVLGDPGAGKTTLLRYLTLKAARRDLTKKADLLPIYIELNAFMASGLTDLLDYAAQCWDGFYAFPHHDANRYIADLLDAGKALLLLDALDETVVGTTAEQAEYSYKLVSQEILRVATRYPQASIVVTARQAGYRQRAPLIGFTELDVLDFRPEDIQQFITNWYANSHDLFRDQKSAALNLRLEQNPRIQELAANPLLLTLIVLVYEARLDLPDGRADLYKRCVDILLTEWDARRNIQRSRRFKPEHKRRLLEVVAWHFHQRGQRYFPEHELLQVIAKFLPSVSLSPEDKVFILHEIANEHGLLKEQAQGLYGFVHLTLQEYFTALAVIDYDHLTPLLKHRANSWWEEVFFLYAGAVSDLSPFLRRLLEQDEPESVREDIFFTNLFLAGSCLTSYPLIQDISLRERVITLLFEHLQTTPYPFLRSRIARTLAMIGIPQVSQRLIHLLSDPSCNRSLRQSIASELGKLRDRSSAPDLVRLLVNPSCDTGLRRGIISALGELGDRSVTPDLLRLLVDPSCDKHRRMDIISALEKLGECGANSDLLRLLADPSCDKRLRSDTFSALYRPSKRGVALEMVRLLADSSLNPGLRERIVSRLGEFVERGANLDLVRLLIDPSLDPGLCERIISSPDRLGERSVAPDLVRLLADPSLDTSLRGRIASALGGIGERSVAPDLVRLLADPSLDKRLRENIILALGKLGERGVAPDLVRLLADPSLDIYLRERVASMLARLGERGVAPDLVRLLADPSLDINLREHIASALGGLGERGVAPDLVRLLADLSLDINLRGHIASALARLGERSVAPDLVRLLADPSLDKRLHERVASVLSELGEHSVAPDLVRLLADPSLDTSLRRRIASALDKLGESSVAPDLVRLLADLSLDKHLRERVASVLSELGERSVAPDLVRLLADPSLDKRLHENIIFALGKLGERGVAPDLVRLLADPSLDKHLRENVASMLGELGERSVAPDLLHLFKNATSREKYLARNIAIALAKLGELSIAPELMQLLKNARGRKEFLAAASILNALVNLGERDVVPDLVQLLKEGVRNKQLHEKIVRALTSLVTNTTTIAQLTPLLNDPRAAQDVYEILWTASKQTGVSLFSSATPANQQGQTIEIVAWE